MNRESSIVNSQFNIPIDDRNNYVDDHNDDSPFTIHD